MPPQKTLIIRDATSKISFALFYIGTAALIAGLERAGAK